jgi:hypothetical protein
MISLAITNKSRLPITHEKTETRFKEVLWRSLGNLFNHCLEFHPDTRGFFPKEFVQPLGQGIKKFSQNRARSFILTSVPCDLFLARPRYSFGLAETFSHGNLQLVLARPRYSFGPTEISSHGDLQPVLAHPRTPFGLAKTSLLNTYFCTNASAGLHSLFLWANRDLSWPAQGTHRLT